MELKIIGEDDRLNHVILSGRLDTAGAREFEAGFLSQTTGLKKPALVDLAGLTFLSSMGIRMLLKAAMELKKQGRKMALLNLPPLAEKAVRASGLDLVMHVARDQKDAVDFLT